jgi:chromosome segregation protein
VYLNNIKLQGFKTFAKKTTLEFNGGITCIVGPNGCGKSNIIDAVRWVLGEQKVSILRSERMENVIFSGSRSKKQLGMAEVSLTIENTKHVLPSEFSEVLITRRLFRSGESEYLINKTPCRLKDINDLFVDTGMGPHSYSVIELKMVESILGGKSDDLLRLFEEAAGINKYKQRREVAIRKLESTELDLSRVTDIISEVERTINSLKRQVGRAERYQNLSQKIEELEVRSASLEFSEIEKGLLPKKDELTQRERSFQKNRTELSRDEANIEKVKMSLLKMEEDLSRLQGEIMALTDSFHQKQNEVVANQERTRACEERIHRNSAECDELRKRIETLRIRLEEGRPRLSELADMADSLRIRHRQKKEELAQFEKTLARRRLEVNDSRMQLIDLMNEIAEKEKERHSLESQLLHLEGREEQLSGEIRRLSLEGDELSQEREGCAQKERDLKSERNKVAVEFESRKKSLATLAEEISQLRDKSSQLKNRLEVLNQQAAFLANLIEADAGYSNGIEFVQNQRKDHPGVLGVLGDLISVPKRYRLAIEAIAGEKVHFIIVRSESDALAMVKELRNRKLGQVTFLILERLGTIGKTNPENAPQNVNGVLATARDVVQGPAELTPLIDFLFASCLLVEDSGTLHKVSGQIDEMEIPWQVASLEGEVSSTFGMLRSGRYEDGEAVSAIGRKDQLNEIRDQIKAIRKELDRHESQLLDRNKKKQILVREIDDWEIKMREIEEAYQQGRIQTAQNQTAQFNLQRSLDSARDELETLRKTTSGVAEKIQRMRPELEDQVDKRSRQEDQVQVLQERLQEFEAQRNLLADEVHELDVDLVRTAGEQASLDAELKRMERTILESENTIKSRERETGESEKEIVALRQANEALADEVKRLELQKVKLQERQSEKKSEYQSLQQTVMDKEGVLKKARELGESSADVLQRLRLEISEGEMRIQNLKDSIQEKYSLEITPIRSDHPEEHGEIRETLERSKERLRLLGPVNLLALDEYKKESERFDFMQRQKNDLVEAKTTLVETIDVINKTASEKFLEVFELIRENFRKNFSAYFEGGEGDLRITYDDDDPLAAKIVILARPQGKRLGAIELLSAGEKALTSIALLFSIYQVKPSPFCILDEVDAPLDDVNVRRYLRVLKEFSQDVQFILVTHNKLTMEAADYIYGVTMEEEGVSKIVSVEMEKEPVVPFD